MYARRMNNLFPLVNFDGAVNRLFDGLLDYGPPPSRFDSRPVAFPAMNVWEDADNVYVEAELPGTNMDDIDIQLLDKQLTIKGRRDAVQDDGVTHHRRERYVGSFERELTIPIEIDAEKTRAELHDGVLTVTLPKAAAARSKSIKVNFESN